MVSIMLGNWQVFTYKAMYLNVQNIIWYVDERVNKILDIKEFNKTLWQANVFLKKNLFTKDFESTQPEMLQFV